MDRNPSPPPEILCGSEEFLPDRIGDSIYSKKWLYKTLMTIVEMCDKSPEEKSMEPNPSSPTSDTVEDSETKTDCGDQTEIIELDPKIEEDACTLWDMSASIDVAEFMIATGVLDIICDIVDKTRSPRLLEIVIGILGNMSSYKALCPKISQNKTVLQTVLQLSGTCDSPTLAQVYRVILCGVRNQNSQTMWFEAIDENVNFFGNFVFVFENSLNCDILNRALQLLNSIMNENVEYCRTWEQEANMKALIKAGTHLNLEDSLDNFYCVLNSLLQYTPNVKQLVGHWKELNVLFTAYFLSFDEEPMPDRERCKPVFSCFDTYNSLLKCDDFKWEEFFIDLDTLKVISRVASSVNAMVLEVRRDNLNVIDMENPSNEYPCPHLRRTLDRGGVQIVHIMTTYEFQLWTVLGDTIVETAKILQTYAEKEAEKEILEDILNSEVVRENIGVIII